MFMYLGIALVAGIFLANQTPINTDLRRIVNSPLIAATISFIVGTIFLAVAALVSEGRLFPRFAFIGTQPAWIWLGGLLGAIYLTSNVLLFPRLGALQTVILPILGQIVMGVIIDSFGLYGSQKILMSWARGFGILLMLAGVFVAVVLANIRHGLQTAEKKRENRLLLWRVWGVIIGALSASQQAINGHLGVVLNAPAEASFISFFIGTVILVIITLAVDKRVPTVRQLRETKPWNWLGGILGGLFILITTLAVPHIGAGLTVMMCLIGQIGGSMIVQQYGHWRSPRYPIRSMHVVGVIIMFAGVVFIKFV